MGEGVHRDGGGAGASTFEGSCELQPVPERSPRVSLHWGEDMLWGVGVWAGAHE